MSRVVLFGWAATFLALPFAGNATAESFQPPMGEPKEITEKTPLLNEDGTLKAWGWARRALMEYEVAKVEPDRPAGIKEWEHYTIVSPEFAVSLTMADIGFAVFADVGIVDFARGDTRSRSIMELLEKDKLHLPDHPYGKPHLESGEDYVRFAYEDGTRTLRFHFGAAAGDPALNGKFVLRELPDQESIAVARPFDTPTNFYYENKIFGMTAAGTAALGDESYTLPEGESYAILDWGRGAWPAEIDWLWGYAVGRVDGKILAFNFGTVNGNDKHGTADAAVYDGKLTKLAPVAWTWHEDDDSKPWQFEAIDGGFHATLDVTHLEEAGITLGAYKQSLHKAHGKFNGSVTLADGTELNFKDFIGFAEHVVLNW